MKFFVRNSICRWRDRTGIGSYVVIILAGLLVNVIAVQNAIASGRGGSDQGGALEQASGLRVRVAPLCDSWTVEAMLRDTVARHVYRDRFQLGDAAIAFRIAEDASRELNREGVSASSEECLALVYGEPGSLTEDGVDRAVLACLIHPEEMFSALQEYWSGEPDELQWIRGCALFQMRLSIVFSEVMRGSTSKHSGAATNEKKASESKEPVAFPSK